MLGFSFDYQAQRNPKDYEVSSGLRGGLEMPPIDFVRSHRFAMLAQKPILRVGHNNDPEYVKVGMFYILDRKEFVKNDRWVFRTVLGLTQTDDRAIAMWTAMEAYIVTSYCYRAAEWNRQQRQMFFYPEKVIPKDKVLKWKFWDY